MKKILLLIISVLMVASLAACGDTSMPDNSNNNQNDVAGKGWEKF